MTGHASTYYDLLDAFRLEGCPACRVSLAGMERYFESLTYESVNDPRLRDEIRAAHGFCRPHSYQWLQQPRALSTAIIYRDVYTHVQDELRALRYDERGLFASIALFLLSRPYFQSARGIPALLAALLRRMSAREVLEAEERCLACRVLSYEEEKAVGTLVGSIDEEGFEEAYSSSTGLCLPHLKQALAGAPHQAAFQSLVEVELARQDVLLGQLEEVIRRENPRFHGLPPGPERGAPGRAVRAAAGAPWGVFETDRNRRHEEWIPVARISRKR